MSFWDDLLSAPVIKQTAGAFGYHAYDPTQGAKQQAFDDAAQQYSDARPEVQRQHAAALQQQLGFFQPYDDLMKQMYGGGAPNPNPNMDSMFDPPTDNGGAHRVPGPVVGGPVPLSAAQQREALTRKNIRMSGLNGGLPKR